MSKNISWLFEATWRDHWDCARFHGSGHANDVKKLFKLYISGFLGNMQLKRCKPKHIKEWHIKLLKTPIAANRALEVLSKMFNFAIEKGWVEYNPCSKVRSFRERKRRRYGTEEEIKKIGEILDRVKVKKPRQVTFILTLLFTGARPISLEKAKYSDLQEINGFGVLTFDGKTTAETGEEEILLIPPHILEDIKKLPKRIDGKIFGIRSPRSLWKKIKIEAGCPDLWIRDLRRTYATVGMSNKIDMGIISELLNHKSVQTTKIYAKLNDSARIEAAKEISNKLSSILGSSYQKVGNE